MKYVFAWVLLFLLLSGCAAESMMPERKYTLNQTAPETEEEWARHSAASDEVQRILPYVRGGKSSVTVQPEEYPAFWAGCYINSDFDLVVLLTEEDQAFLRELRDVSGNEDLLFEIVPHSYGELLLFMKELDKKWPQMQELGVKSWGLDEYQNGIAVYMEDVSPEHIAVFRETISDSELLSFHLMTGEITY